MTKSEKDVCQNQREREGEKERCARPADRLRKDVKMFKRSFTAKYPNQNCITS